MRGRLFGLLVGLMSILFSLVEGGAPAMADDPPAVDRLIGEAVADFALNDVMTGKPVRLADFADKKAVVLVFTGIDCPVVNLYMPRLVEFQERFKDRGVAFLAINANASESIEAIAAHARDSKLGFPMLRDEAGRVMTQLQAERTGETLVLDAQRRLRYRGAIDDQYGYGRRKEKAVHTYLADAIEAVLGGQELETSATSVVGCPIERPDRIAERPLPRIRRPAPAVIEALKQSDPDIDPDSIGPVTYAEHVAPIMQAKCQSCHRAGQVGPFPLLTFDHAKRWADAIHETVDSRRMPPWHADPRFGLFANDRKLSARERATMLAWIEQGTPRGDAACEPAPKAWPEGWSIGTPDIVFQVPDDYVVKPDGALPYQRFRVKTGFTEDKWVTAIEPRPGDRSVVHHIVIYLIQPGKQVRSFDDLEHLAAYAPGDLPTRLPAGVAKRIPAGAELLFELHYTPMGRVRIDRSSVGMMFAKEPPKFRAYTMPIVNDGFRIPPGESNYPVSRRKSFDQDLQIVGFLPHMHLRGKDFKYTAKYPDGREEVLLSVPQYDFAWQSYYWLANPKVMPRGSSILCEAHFDNSKNNPALSDNDTAKEVRWGEQTWQEMMIGYADVIVPVDGNASGGGAADGKL